MTPLFQARFTTSIFSIFLSFDVHGLNEDLSMSSWLKNVFNSSSTLLSTKTPVFKFLFNNETNMTELTQKIIRRILDPHRYQIQNFRARLSTVWFGFLNTYVVSVRRANGFLWLQGLHGREKELAFIWVIGFSQYIVGREQYVGYTTAGDHTTGYGRHGVGRFFTRFYWIDIVQLVLRSLLLDGLVRIGWCWTHTPTVLECCQRIGWVSHAEQVFYTGFEKFFETIVGVRRFVRVVFIGFGLFRWFKR